MKKIFSILVILLVCVFINTSIAQKGYDFSDSVRYKKNVIRWNVTPFLLWGSNNLNFSYERVLKPYRSISVNAGYFVIPSFTKGRLLDSLDITHNNSKSGFNLAADYRFYFRKLNVNNAPAGLYWGVYSTYYFYQFENSAQILDNDNIQSQITFGGKFNVLFTGLELGYQFLIKERLAIDLIFLAPSVGLYTSKFNLKSDMNINEEDEYIQKIYDALTAKIPGFEELVNSGYTSKSGINTNFGPGIRYMIQIGYRF